MLTKWLYWIIIVFVIGLIIKCIKRIDCRFTYSLQYLYDHYAYNIDIPTISKFKI